MIRAAYRISTGICFAMAAGHGAPIAAQDDSEADTAAIGAASPAAASTRSTFLPEEFARFAPRSALDMARQVPGFTIREGDGARGLGQADTNVLVNGRRISGKSTGPVEALQRIPLEDVLRYLSELSKKGDVIACHSTRFIKGKKIEGMLYRVSGYTPAASAADASTSAATTRPIASL